jgi:D-aminopeptidase
MSTSSPLIRLETAVRSIPATYPGPGGAAAVLKDGQEVVRHVWGFANMERRIPFGAGTGFRICSITKQFTCGLVLERFPDPAVLDADIRDRLPHLGGRAPSALSLCHNQSGLRDYWAMAMLQGAQPESSFGELEARRLIQSTRTLQFEPGTRYSYANQNFRILSDILQERTGRSLAELLQTTIFDRIGMTGAFLAPETQSLPDGTVGYEGTRESGFRVAENRIFWTGDAGLAAGLEDLIAWERHIDATREDAQGLYRRLSTPVKFSNGAPASYSFGLSHQTAFGRGFTGHGGQLRGWRSYRLYVPAERLSVVVLFNHLYDAGSAAISLLAAWLGAERATAGAGAPDWHGTFLDSETGTIARIAATPGGDRSVIQFGDSAEELSRGEDGWVSKSSRLWLTPGGPRMERPEENFSSLLQRCEGAACADWAGRYYCAETDSELTLSNPGDVAFGGFSGRLGSGRMERLEHVGGDVWTLPCQRALDQPPPGEWTLAFVRHAGQISAVRVGCWLARGLVFSRVD